MLLTGRQLEEVAGSLRSVGRVLVMDVDGLLRRGGPDTWRGPAATAHQFAARGVLARLEDTAEDLHRVAARLEARAGEEASAEAGGWG